MSDAAIAIETSPALLEVKDLAVEFDTYGGVVKAVRGVGFKVEQGKHWPLWVNQVVVNQLQCKA